MDHLYDIHGLWLGLGAAVLVAAVTAVCVALGAAAERVERILTEHREEET